MNDRRDDNEDNNDDDEKEIDVKEVRIKRISSRDKDKKKEWDEKPIKGVRKKPNRARIDYDPDEDYGYLEDMSE